MTERFEIKMEEIEALAKVLAEAPSSSAVKLSKDGNVLIARYKLQPESDVY